MTALAFIAIWFCLALGACLLLALFFAGRAPSEEQRRREGRP